MDEHGLGWEERPGQSSRPSTHEPHGSGRGPRDIHIFNRHLPRIAESSARSTVASISTWPSAASRPRHHRLHGPCLSEAPCAWPGSPATRPLHQRRRRPPHGDHQARHPQRWYAIWPERFSKRKTNGVTPRRWLKRVQPPPGRSLDEVTGSTRGSATHRLSDFTGGWHR